MGGTISSHQRCSNQNHTINHTVHHTNYINHSEQEPRSPCDVTVLQHDRRTPESNKSHMAESSVTAKATAAVKHDDTAMVHHINDVNLRDCGCGGPSNPITATNPSLSSSRSARNTASSCSSDDLAQRPDTIVYCHRPFANPPLVYISASNSTATGSTIQTSRFMDVFDWGWYDKKEYSSSIRNSYNSLKSTEEIDKCFYDNSYDDEVDEDEETDDDYEPSNPMFVWDEVDEDDENIVAPTPAMPRPSSYASITISEIEYPSLAMAALMSTTERKGKTSATNEVPCLRDGNGPKHIGRKWMRIDRTIDSRPVVDHTDHSSSTTSAYDHGINLNNEDDGSSYDPGYHPGRRFQVIPFHPRTKSTKAQRKAKRTSKCMREAKFQLGVLMKEEKASKRSHRS